MRRCAWGRGLLWGTDKLETEVLSEFVLRQEKYWGYDHEKRMCFGFIVNVYVRAPILFLQNIKTLFHKLSWDY